MHIRTQTDRKWDGYPQKSKFIKYIGAGIRHGVMLDIVMCECYCLNIFEQELREDSQLENAVVLWKGNVV